MEGLIFGILRCIFEVVIYNEHIPGPGHSFPVRNDFSHAEQESQQYTE